MTNADPGQVIDVLRDVLLDHMQGDAEGKGLPHYRVQSAVYIGKEGGLLSEGDIGTGKDMPAGLRLTMRNGAEYDLILKRSVKIACN